MRGMRGMWAYGTKFNADNVWYVWNAGVVQYKVQCRHADSSEWNVWCVSGDQGALG